MGNDSSLFDVKSFRISVVLMPKILEKHMLEAVMISHFFNVTKTLIKTLPWE